MAKTDPGMTPTERQKLLRYVQKKRAEKELRMLTPTF
jgi:hypothetical protein